MLAALAIALCCALALALLTDLSSASKTLPPHGIFESSLAVEQVNDAACSIIEQPFKINDFSETGFIDKELMSCPWIAKGMPPVKLKVTVFDYQPYTRIDIDIDDAKMHVKLFRAYPYGGTLYGVMQKCCLPYIKGNSERNPRAAVDDVIVELPEIPARMAYRHFSA